METLQQLKTAQKLLQAAQFALNKIPNRRLAFGPYDQTYDLAAAIDQFFGDEPHSRLTAAESNELEMLEIVDQNWPEGLSPAEFRRYNDLCSKKGGA